MGAWPRPSTPHAVSKQPLVKTEPTLTFVPMRQHSPDPARS